MRSIPSQPVDVGDLGKTDTPKQTLGNDASVVIGPTSQERVELADQSGDVSLTAHLPRLGFTMRETSVVLGVSYMTVFRLAKRGLLRPSKALRTKIFSREEIERFLRETST